MAGEQNQPQRNNRLSISKVDPSSGNGGDLKMQTSSEDVIKIHGTGFGGSQKTSMVTLGGDVMPVVSWSDTLIAVRVPWHGKTALISVAVGNEITTTDSPFTVL